MPAQQRTSYNTSGRLAGSILVGGVDDYVEEFTDKFGRARQFAATPRRRNGRRRSCRARKSELRWTVCGCSRWIGALPGPHYFAMKAAVHIDHWVSRYHPPPRVQRRLIWVSDVSQEDQGTTDRIKNRIVMIDLARSFRSTTIRKLDSVTSFQEAGALAILCPTARRPLPQARSLIVAFKFRRFRCENMDGNSKLALR